MGPIDILIALGFVAGLATTLVASELLVRGLTRLGSNLSLSEGLVGLLGALGADSPELSSAVIAIVAGAGGVGVGVVVGSNLFNLAALLGISAIVAGGVRIRRGALVFDAAVGLFVAVAAATMVGGRLSPGLTAVLVFAVSAAYVFVLAAPGARPVHDRPEPRPESRPGPWLPVALLPVALAGVVGGSFVMVHEALAAQSWLRLSTAVLGTIVLAALTSLPNLWVALHFARADRGTALLSAAMNSNTINLAGGLVVPALFVGAGQAAGSRGDFFWLILLTLLAVVAPLPRSRLTRTAGGAIIAIYLVFVVVRVAWV